MPEVMVYNMPHKNVCRGVIRVEVDGVLFTATILSALNETLHRLNAEWKDRPVTKHPAITLCWHPEDFQEFFKDEELVAPH